MAVPDTYLCLGLFLLRCSTLHFCLLKLTRFLSAHFSSLTRTLWVAAWSSDVAATSPSFVSSANSLRVHSAQLYKSLIEMLNSTLGYSAPYWPQLGFAPPASTHWAQLFSPFLNHLTVCSSSSYINRFFMRILWETM